MRVAAGVLIAIVLGAAPAVARPVEPPAIEDAIANAASRGRPLVIEFHASWCGPCRELEDNVLADPAVKRALAAVELVRYDLDSAVGAQAARRFGVTTVPTILVLDRRGGVAVRERGLRGGGPAGQIAWFLGVLHDAPADQRGAAELEDAVRDRPDDLNARMQLADRYRAMGRPLDAIPQYRVVAFAPAAYDGARARAATATAAHDALIATEARLQVAIDAALELVRRFPESREAAIALALIVESGRVPRDQVDALLQQHRGATHDLTAAVRLALLAGAPDDAATLVRRALADRPRDPTARLLAAEIAADAGDGRAAAEVVREVCADATPEIVLHCHVLESGLAIGRRSPGVMSLRDVADRTLGDLEHPGAHPPELSELDAVFATASAQLLRDAGRRCARGGEARTLLVLLAVDDDGGAAALANVYEADPPLEACLRAAIGAQVLPPAPAALEHRLVEYVYVPAAGDGGPAPSGPVDHGLGRGAITYGFMRAGDVVAIGVGSTAMIDAGGVGDLRAVLGGELEGGVDTANHGFYAARALAGAGLGTPRGGVVSALIGVGAGDRGAGVATEIPVELRLELGRGRPRVHLWIRSSYLRGDETALGAGVTVRVDGAPVFVGAAVTDSGAGRSASLRFGLPVGRWF